MNASEWEISAPGGACAGCGRSFEDAEAFYSRLALRAEGGYERRDLCERCWGMEDRESAVSVWKTFFRVPPPKPEEPVRRETAESLLRQLLDHPDPEKTAVVFVLAVMLERRRVLVEREVQYSDEGPRRRVYEHRGTGETFLIADPELRLADLEPVQRSVMELLGPPAAPENPLPAEPGNEPPEAVQEPAPCTMS